LCRFSTGDFSMRTVDCSLFEFISAILRSEMVVSSSLHGLIVAESLGIPAILMRPPEAEAFRKYKDYYYGTGRYGFPVINDPAEAHKTSIPEIPKPPKEWESTLPTFDELAASGLIENLYLFDDDIIPTKTEQRTNIDIGRLAGDFFVMTIETETRAEMQIVISTKDAVLHDGIAQPNSSGAITIEVDGEVVEASGGIIHVKITALKNNELIPIGRISGKPRFW
jgi:hypothetical protein